MTVSIDDRAGSLHLLPLIQQLGLPCRRTRLQYADVAFRGNLPDAHVLVGVEVKRLSDFISSFLTKRLQEHQLPGMVARYQERWLVVQGEYREGKDGMLEVPIREHWKGQGQWRLWIPQRGGLTHGQLEGALLTIGRCAGFSVMRTRDDGETARWIGGLYRWWQKKDHGGHKAIAQVQRPEWNDGWFQRKERFAEKVALQVRGLGMDKAPLVAQHFGTALDMANAPAREWAKVPGVGKELAERAWRSFRMTS